MSCAMGSLEKAEAKTRWAQPTEPGPRSGRAQTQ